MEISERLERMHADTDFMAWLKEYLPDYESEYSGDLLGLHEAWKAGRLKERVTCAKLLDDWAQHTENHQFDPDDVAGTMAEVIRKQK